MRTMKRIIILLSLFVVAVITFAQEYNPYQDNRFEDVSTQYYGGGKKWHLVTHGENRGALDEKGNIRIPIKYRNVRQKSINYYDSENRYTTYNYFYVETHDNKVALYDEDFKEILPFVSGDDIEVQLFDNHLFDKRYYVVGDSKTHLKGVYSIQGTMIVPQKYEYISGEVVYSYVERTKQVDYCCFSVKVGESCGIVSEQGKTLVSTSHGYDYISPFKNGRGEIWYRVQKKEKSGIVDSNDKVIVPLAFNFVADSGDMFQTYKGEVEDGKNGIYSYDGREILAAGIYDYADCELKMFKEDNSVFYRIYRFAKGYENFNNQFDNAEMGLLNKDGAIIVPCSYSSISALYGSQSILEATKGKDNEIIDLYTKDGRKLFSDHLTYCSRTDDLYLCCKKGKYGYIDNEGKVVVDFKYDMASAFEDGVAQVSENGVTTLLPHPLKGTSLQLSTGGLASTVDVNIPQTSVKRENTFAFIVANENYSHYSGADYSINDGKIFAEYCKKTFGLPEANVRYYEDASYGNMTAMIQRMKDIADVYEGDASIILYFSGLGVCDEKTKERILLPIDASPAALEQTGIKVNHICEEMGLLNTKLFTFIVDAPFSGKDKVGNPLAENRGVAVSPRSCFTKGNTILCLSQDKGETAYSGKKYGHSIFTYHLLQSMAKHRISGNISEMLKDAVSATKKTVLSEYDKVQEPSIVISPTIGDKRNKITF